MFCPQCGHQQSSNDMRFCSRCGLPLGLITDVVSGKRDQLQREKRELTGVGLMLATVLMSLNFLLVFGVTTLPHLSNPVFLWIWLSFMLTALVVGGIGLANLIRGGFFKRLKARETQLRLMKAEQDRQDEARTLSADSGTTPLLNGPPSVVEVTTRELDPISRSRQRK